MMNMLSKGSVVEQLYRVEDTFESGGMGIVYKVHHLAWDIDMVMKCPRVLPDNRTKGSQLEQFTEECRLWAKVGLHPFVATCFYARSFDELPYSFAEFVEGGSLRDWIEDRRLYRGDSDAALARIIGLATQAAWGLSAAHEIELVHADIKPGNILVTSDGAAKITDFGLARILESGEAAISGRTPAYASPEQARGERVTEATDIWSWAATVLEMFTGGILWENGPAAGACLAEFGEKGAKAVGIPKMPSRVFDLLNQCLQWDPSKRPRSFPDIAEELLRTYEELFDEPCEHAQRPDLELLAADSLNNRAVSLLDLQQADEAAHLLERALAVDPHHPEATYNLGLVRQSQGEMVDGWVVANLTRAADAEPGSALPCKLLGFFHLRKGHTSKAKEFFAQAVRKASADAEAADISKANTSGQIPSFVLAKPRSGSEFHADLTRFQRLMHKTELALTEYRLQDAKRYLRMARDIHGFARHPELKRLGSQLRIEQ